MGRMKAIETVYNGYRFRSRLEARWAVFFDALNLEYQYEPEGFDLGGIWYLPDFWLPLIDTWVEVKGKEPTKGDVEKATLLNKQSDQDVVIVYGGNFKIDQMHDKGPYMKAMIFPAIRVTREDALSDNDHPSAQLSRFLGHFCLHNTLERVSKLLGKRERYPNSLRSPHLWSSCIVVYPSEEKIIEALDKARQARFEHGENGRE